MKLLLSCILAIIFIVAVTAERPTYTLASQWSTLSTTSGLNVGISAKKDLLVYPDLSNPSVPAITIRRRNAEGVYVTVANFTEAVDTSTGTNGKWISVTSASGTPSSVTLFSIDGNNNISRGSVIPTCAGYLLSDDTFVGFDPVLVNGATYTFRTYQYSASTNTWSNIPGTELVVRAPALFFGDASTYRATDTHLVFLDFSNLSNFTVNIYERQADRSWKFFDLIPVISTFDGIPGSVSFNGETLVFARMAATLASQTYGEVYVYTKTNNGWTSQTFNLLALGYRPQGFLGYTVVFVDADTMMFSVGLDSYTNGYDPSGGKVLLLTRENGVWKDTVDLVGSPGLFGTGLAINDHDLIVAAITSTSTPFGIAFFVAPLCFAKPINVTCNDQQLDSCSDLNVTSMYIVNNPQCGAVTVSTNGLALVNNQELQVRFSFTKSYGPPAYCNSTITCPAPPVAPFAPVVPVIAPVAPVAPVVPVIAPVAPAVPVIAPVNVVAPVVVPVTNIQGTPTSTRVSSAGIIQLGLVYLATIVALL